MPKINFDEERALSAFVRQMVADKGLLEEDKKQYGKIQHRLRVQLDERLEAAMIDALSDEQMVELDRRLDAGMTDLELETFFEEAGADYESAMMKAMAEFRKDYLDGSIDVTDASKSEPVQGAVSDAPGESDVEGESLVQAEVVEAGEPVQGTTSETPGASDVEGTTVNMTEVTEE